MNLVVNGQNGYRVPTDGNGLFLSIQKIADLSDEEGLVMEEASVAIINHWSNRNLGESLIGYIEIIRAKRDSVG